MYNKIDHNLSNMTYNTAIFKKIYKTRNKISYIIYSAKKKNKAIIQINIVC